MLLYTKWCRNVAWVSWEIMHTFGSHGYEDTVCLSDFTVIDL